MTSHTTHVFVYGTLLFDEVTSRLGIQSKPNSRFLQKGKGALNLIKQPAVLMGYQRFRVRLRKLGNFPAILPADGEVSGQVLLDLTPESLIRLDDFEGLEESYYSRQTVTVKTNDDMEISAEVYVCGEYLRSFLDGTWCPESFRKHELDWYLKHIVTV